MSLNIKENEKLLAFGLLLLGIMLLVWWALKYPPEKDQVIRLLDGALGGLLLAFGAAANALFRIGSVGEEKMKEAGAVVLASTSSNVSPPSSPQPVVIQQPKGEPLPVVETPAATRPAGGSDPAADGLATIPPMFREEQANG